VKKKTAHYKYDYPTINNAVLFSVQTKPQQTNPKPSLQDRFSFLTQDQGAVRQRHG